MTSHYMNLVVLQFNRFHIKIMLAAFIVKEMWFWNSFKSPEDHSLSTTDLDCNFTPYFIWVREKKKKEKCRVEHMDKMLEKTT